MTYRYVVRHFGRGRTVAHLADDNGDPLCDVRLSEAWGLTNQRHQRRICTRCKQAHAALVAMVRAELGDTTDYSKE